jgi:hypothetical protein
MYAPKVLKLAEQRLEGVCEPGVNRRVVLCAICKQDCSRASGFAPRSGPRPVAIERGISPATGPVSIQPIA